MAVQHKITPDAVESFIGLRAQINTTRDGDRDRMTFAEYEVVDGDLPNGVKSMRHIVYWHQGNNGLLPYIVGIAWNEDMTPVYFRARILHD